WMVHAMVKAVGGRVALIPWVFFLVTGILTGFGAVVPAAVAIIAPMGMGFARQYRIPPLLMGLMVINGATAGGFSPLSIFGTITNQVVERNDLPGSPVLLFLVSFAFNVILGLVCFFLFGGRDLLGKRDTGHGLEDTRGGGGTAAAKVPDTPRDDPERRAARRSVQTTMVKDEDAEEQVTTLDRNRIITLIGLIVLAVMVVPPL